MLCNGIRFSHHDSACSLLISLHESLHVFSGVPANAMAQAGGRTAQACCQGAAEAAQLAWSVDRPATAHTPARSPQLTSLETGWRRRGPSGTARPLPGYCREQQTGEIHCLFQCRPERWCGSEQLDAACMQQVWNYHSPAQCSRLPALHTTPRHSPLVKPSLDSQYDEEGLVVRGVGPRSCRPCIPALAACWLGRRAVCHKRAAAVNAERQRVRGPLNRKNVVVVAPGLAVGLWRRHGPWRGVGSSSRLEHSVQHCMKWPATASRVQRSSTASQQLTLNPFPRPAPAVMNALCDFRHRVDGLRNVNPAGDSGRRLSLQVHALAYFHNSPPPATAPPAPTPHSHTHTSCPRCSTHSPLAGQGPYFRSTGNIQKALHRPCAGGVGTRSRPSTRSVLNASPPCCMPGTKDALASVLMRPLV